MATINRILFFEDDDDIRSQLEKDITKVATDIDLIMADGSLVKELLGEGSGKAIEDAFAENIKNKFSDGIDLIVADHDLSKLDSKLSESVVTAAAHQLAIPVCRYHRRAASATVPLNWDLNSKVFAVDVELGDGFVDKLLDVMEGFKLIREKYSTTANSIRKNGPAAILAHILGAEGQVTHLSLYTSGVAFFNDPFIVSKSVKKEDLSEELERRIPYVLSYWLLNVVLEFPGIILNEIAAGSFLNLRNFTEEPLNSYFDDAKYKGPFSNCQTYWWRAILEDMLNCDDVDVFLKGKGFEEDIIHSQCSVDPDLSAGYYDIFSEEQISIEKSVGNLSWIPEGADLTRAEKDRYEELAPILNL